MTEASTPTMTNHSNPWLQASANTPNLAMKPEVTGNPAIPNNSTVSAPASTGLLLASP